MVGHSLKWQNLYLGIQELMEAPAETFWYTSTHRLTVPTEVPYWAAG